MNIYSVLAMIMGVLMTAGSLFTVYQYRKKMIRSCERFIQVLDGAIAGEIQECEYDESMDSAICKRLNRLVQISSMRMGQAEGERDIVKSLISDISHQVRTPLSNIMLYTDLLKEQQLEPSVVQLVEKVRKNSDKLDFFMKELIKTSYTEQEIISVSPEMTDVEELIEKACQNVEMLALKKRIKIKREISSGQCFADQKWTIEAIGNVIENGVKYAPDGSELLICTENYEAFICVRVVDRGPGIPEEEQGKVFERFYRGKQVKQEAGFGIGLYLTREVLLKQGGYVKIKSAPRQGTCVELYLSRFAV